MLDDNVNDNVSSISDSAGSQQVGYTAPSLQNVRIAQYPNIGKKAAKRLKLEMVCYVKPGPSDVKRNECFDWLASASELRAASLADRNTMLRFDNKDNQKTIEFKALKREGSILKSQIAVEKYCKEL